MKKLKPGTRVRINRKVAIIGGRVATVVRPRNHIESGRVMLHVPLGRKEFWTNRPTGFHVAREMLKEVK